MIEVDHGRWRQLRQSLVEDDYLLPIGVFESCCSRMTFGNRRLQAVRASSTPDGVSSFQRRKPTRDL